jgi:transcriptional regulator with XRE-family HTH domain
MSAFGKLMKSLRIKAGLTLREFCDTNGLDPGNYSRLERGLLPPPQKKSLLEKYAQAVGLVPDSDEWTEFFDTAAASRGEVPPDLMTNEQIVEKLPLVFRTIRGSRMTKKGLDDLIAKIKES